uniref:Ig-like domain-containing protein n=1 Tax=Esox lucius TaxID=8010 RepID=A0A6Q2YL15_ESOLU
MSLGWPGNASVSPRKSWRNDILKPILCLIADRPKAVLSISPQWMNSGDSVTLNCEVKESSTGWRFSWYKTVPYRAGLPSLLDKPYSVEPLSGYGTTEESYTRSPAGPTDTGGYVCKAGRGDPVYYTDYSEPQGTLLDGD